MSVLSEGLMFVKMLKLSSLTDERMKRSEVKCEGKISSSETFKVNLNLIL